MTRLTIPGPFKSSLTHKNNVQIARLLTGSQKGTRLYYMGSTIGTVIDVAINEYDQLLFTIDFDDEIIIPEDIERFIIQAQVLAQIVDSSNTESIIKVENVILTYPEYYEENNKESQFLTNGKIDITDEEGNAIQVLEETTITDKETGKVLSKSTKDITKEVKLVNLKPKRKRKARKAEQ